jgi:outer membrane receptor for ferrienterochelin and colicins
MKYIFLLWVLFLSHNIFAQNSFKAIVKDKGTKQKIVGATAFIDKLKVGIQADTSGFIILTNIPNGEFEIAFSYVGYEKKEVNIIFPLPGDQPAEILLQKENENLGEVTVTSTRTNSLIKDIPVRVEVIGSEELNDEGNMRPSNIAMLLAEATGIQSQQTSAINGNISIRLQGLDGKYTQILKDGFPSYGGLHKG